MDDELNLDLDQIESNTEERLKVKNRFQQLSEKVILTSKERDELAEAKQVLESEKDSLSKERDFYKDFSTNVTKYPHASEYQEQILEKVKNGYSTEDAMVAVLAKEGKLTMPAEAPAPSPQVEGGSSPTVISGDKSMSDMTAEEKMSALAKLDKTGALANALRGR
jgi:hypothetical protein